MIRAGASSRVMRALQGFVTRARGARPVPAPNDAQSEDAEPDDAEPVTVLQHDANRDAQRASGWAVLLLAPGAVPRDGAVAAALATLRSDPGIGAVGGRVVGPDGRVQEAGRIVWSTGATTGYGQGLPPDAGPVLARRDVDACAVFLLVPRRVFLALGGYDPAFPPGLAATSDLCLRIRGGGYRVVYEPRAIIDAPAAAPAPAQQQRQLRARHLGTLDRPPTLDVFARDAAPRKRLLVIDGFVPLRVMGAGYPRAQALLNAADALGWSVTLLTLDLGSPGFDNTYAELAHGIEVLGGIGAAGLPGFLRDRPGFYDVVLVSRPETMRAVRDALAPPGADPGKLDAAWPGARLVYDAEALFTGRRVQQAALAGTPLAPAEQAAMLAEELALVDGADAVLAVTPAEAATLRAGQAAPVTVLSHPVSPRDGPGFSARSGFLFIGRLLEKEAPNYDGLRWFIATAWPGIRAALGDVPLTVVGALHADPADLEAPGVRLLGPQAALHPFYDAARVFVAPARFAAGVPIKVLEAGEAGLPVLTTGLIAAQLGWTDAEAIAAADDPAAVVDRAVALHRDEAAWTAMRTRATQRLRAEHGEDSFRRSLAAVLNGSPGV